MSTSDSPIEKLTAEAATIARKLKTMTWYDGKGRFKFGIVQDDKVITVEITSEKINESTEESLTQWLLSYMRGETPQ